jgi:hypothetical protein
MRPTLLSSVVGVPIFVPEWWQNGAPDRPLLERDRHFHALGLFDLKEHFISIALVELFDRPRPQQHLGFGS